MRDRIREEFFGNIVVVLVYGRWFWGVFRGWGWGSGVRMLRWLFCVG